MDEAPVQMTFVGVKELHIETYWPITPATIYTPAEGVIQHAIGAFDAEKRTIQVRLRFVSGVGHSPSADEIKRMQEEKRQPFHLRAEVVGEFIVSSGSMPDEHVPEWAKINAAPILMPFLREQVHTLSVRAGVNPVLLPLIFANPSIKLEQAETALNDPTRGRRACDLVSPSEAPARI